MPVKVPPKVSPRSGDASTLFEIGWGVPPSGDVADVQVAFCAASTPCTSFTMWRHGTPGPVADFGASDPAWQGSGTYYFRARVRQATTGAKSDWSPVRGIVVA